MRKLSVVVVSVSKIEISKAIHNLTSILLFMESVVVSVSKIEISKAIHNTNAHAKRQSELLSVCQR